MNDRLPDQGRQGRGRPRGRSGFVGYVGFWQWGVCRVTVPPGREPPAPLQGPVPLRHHGHRRARRHAGPARLLGPDPSTSASSKRCPAPAGTSTRRWSSSGSWCPDILIEPGKIGIVTAKMGRSLPPGTFLVDREGDRGVLRKVLTPGRYRINKYAFDVRIAEAVRTPAFSEGPPFFGKLRCF